jgi:hypothetical protein
MYRCSVCQEVSKPGQAQMKHVLYNRPVPVDVLPIQQKLMPRVQRNITCEIPVCEDCFKSIERIGFPMTNRVRGKMPTVPRGRHHPTPGPVMHKNAESTREKTQDIQIQDKPPPVYEDPPPMIGEIADDPLPILDHDHDRAKNKSSAKKHRAVKPTVKGAPKPAPRVTRSKDSSGGNGKKKGTAAKTGKAATPSKSRNPPDKPKK